MVDFIKTVGSFPKGTTQTQLVKVGAFMAAALGVLAIGNQSVGLGAGLQSVMLTRDTDKWLPKTGHATQMVRRGRAIVADPATLDVQMSTVVEPNRSSKLGD